ncbi:solute carrier family 22 member 2-like isoform X2 [Ambystoma mexicanum]|uniref:solute carrier family 22 member 2-like isoform X2 n=1 Tax=Ambystoma mexicanum TaxID=8296 RepID=UPI0037E92477
MPTFDDLLEHIGEFNLFQKQTFFILCFISAAFSPVYVGIVFFGLVPKHRCRAPGVSELSARCDWSLDEEIRLTVPGLGGSNETWFESQCRRYDVDWNDTALGCTDPLSHFTSYNRSSIQLTTCTDGWVYNTSGSSIVTEIWKKTMSSYHYLHKCNVWDAHGLCSILHTSRDIAHDPRTGQQGMLAIRLYSHCRICRIKPEEDCWYCLPSRFHCGTSYTLGYGICNPTLANLADCSYCAKFLLPALLLSLQSADAACENEKQTPAFLDMVRTPQIRKYTFILMYIWFSCAVLYQGLIMHMGIAGGDIYFDFFISALTEFPAAIIILLTVDRVGRRYPWAIGSFVAGVACLINAFIPHGLDWLKVTMAYFSRMGITLSYEMICLVNAELYPTFIRNLGIMVCSSMCDLGGIITPFLVYRLAEVWHELPLVVFAAVGMTAGGLVLLLPETKGKALPETVEDAENLHRQKKINTERVTYLEVRTSDV